jgi:hypothetical protein
MSPYVEDRLWPGVLDEVPDVFRSCVEDPVFSYDGLHRVIACMWRETEDAWSSMRRLAAFCRPSGHFAYRVRSA